MDDLIRIENALNMTKDKSKYVLRGAINKTLKDADKRIRDDVLKEYSIKDKKKVFSAMDIQKASVSNLVGILNVTGKPNETWDFKVGPRTYVPGGLPVGHPGHKVNVKRRNPYKILKLRSGGGDQYKAFTVRFSNGKTTLAQRVPGKRMNSNPDKEFVKKIMSPSVPSMVNTLMGGEEGLYTETNAFIHESLQRNMITEMQRFLK